MYNVDYNLQGARVMKTLWNDDWFHCFWIFENHYELELAGALFSYDISDVEHYYNTLYGNYTIAELISLHILSPSILLTLLKWFSVVFYV